MSAQIRKKRDFTEGPIFSRMILYTLPVIITGLLQLCYNMADNIVVGKFSGDEFALAAVGATGSLNTLIINVLMGIGAGAGVVVAHAYGAKNDKEVSRATHTSLTFSLIAGIAFGLIFYFVSAPALRLMEINPIFIDKSILYMQLLAFGVPASAVYNYAAAIIRNIGDSKTPLIILSASGLLNVGLNLVFVTIFDMTVDGVALATVISQYASAISAISVLMYRKHTCYAFSFKKIGIDLGILKKSLRLGIPQGIQGAMFSISNVLLVSSMNTFDAHVFTGYTITNNIDSIVYHVVNGFAVAALTFTAQNYGAKNLKRIRKSFLYATVQVSVAGFLTGMLVLLFNEPLSMLFMPDNASNIETVISVMDDLTTMLLSTYFLLGILSVISASLRGLGYSILQMILYVIGLCGSRILWIYLVFPIWKTPVGLMVCYPVSWIVSMILLFVAWLFAHKKLKREMQAVNESVNEP